MKRLLPILLLTALTACSNDEDNLFEKKLSGQYQITSISSEVDFDMNNDGVKTKDIFKEISDQYNTIDGQAVSFYNFSYAESFLRIRSDAKLISFGIPDQYIDVLTDGTAFLGSYVNSAYAYTYEFNMSNKVIRVIDKGSLSIDNNIVLGIEILESGQLRIRLKKNIFDFVDSTWTEVQLTLTYTKVLQ